MHFEPEFSTIIKFNTHRRDLYALSHLLAMHILGYELYDEDHHPDAFTLVVPDMHAEKAQRIVEAWAI